MTLGALHLMLHLVVPDAAALTAALDLVEPPPALRASFKATLSSQTAQRTITYDPMRPGPRAFQVVGRVGQDEELDAIVAGWRAERQADVRLFADDLRMSLGAARLVDRSGQTHLEFRHQISPNGGPADALVSSRMIGEMALDPRTGRLRHVDYRIVRPVRLDDGTVISDYAQRYAFGYSTRWDVSYVSSYQLEARGGRWGFRDSRRFSVVVNDVAFSLASDARQELSSR